MLLCAEFFQTRIFPRAKALCFAGLIFVILNIFFIDRASAADPTGVWLIKDRDAKIQIKKCGGALCGAVVWIKQPNDPDTGKPWLDKNNIDPKKRSRPLLGLIIPSEMKPSGLPNKWVGKVYSVVRGNSYDGSVALLSPKTLKIEGCLAPLLCQSEIWTRAD